MFLRALIQFLFPSTCVVCKKSPARLHLACAEKLHPAETSPYPWIFSCYRYKDQRVEKLIRHLKNKEDLSLGEVLGKILYALWQEHCPSSPQHIDIIVAPVPARKERLKNQGFNQAELLARNFARCNPHSTYIKKLLERVRETDKQALIHDKTKRRENLRNAFAVHPNQKKYIQQKTVIIIDDVSTSGATLNEIKTALENAGAKQVFAITLAH